MQIRNGMPVILTAALLFAIGCERQDSSQFQQYADDKSATKTLPANGQAKTVAQEKSDGGTKTKQGSSTASDRGDDLADILPAALGFGSRPILGESFRVAGEQWLTPAVGTGATLALVNGLESPRIEKTADAAATGKQPSALKQKVPRKVQVLVKDRKFREEGPQNAIRISYNDIDLLKVLNMDPVIPDAPKLMPQWLKNLNGKRVRIRGFMGPAFQSTGLRSFLMGRDNKACCMGPNAKVYDVFLVKMRKGVTTSYMPNRPFDVVGIFQIKPWIEDGEVLQLYQMEDAIVVQ